MPLDYRYEVTTAGTLPIDLAVAKKYLKIDGGSDNSVIQDLIATVIQWGERHTGRDFRVKTWKLFLDCFQERILIRKSQVNTITSIQHIVSDSLVTVASTVYQFKKGYQFSEILLRFDQVWPINTDEIEAGIEIIFVTKIPRNIESYKSAALQHLAYLYENRGDCSTDEAAKASGAIETYGSRIPRI